MTAEQSPLLGREVGIPPAPFTRALSPAMAEGDEPMRLPQAIAHRGYKAAYPENTLGAFRGAVGVGSHAIETDLHLSKDGVVVLSHDATLERCFGRKEKIADCDWSYLSGLRTVRPPHDPMPRLVDLLAYLAQPGLEDIWLLLDIKRDDDPEELVECIAAAIASVPPSRPWKDRVVLGCWNAQYIELSKEYLAGFPISFIGFSLLYAATLLKEPNVHFNLLRQTLVGPCGSRFIAAARKRGRSVFVWTVNEEEWMEWSIRKGVDGVNTDDPKLFLEVCGRRSSGETGTEADGKALAGSARKPPPSQAKQLRQLAAVVAIQLLATLMTALVFIKSAQMARKRRRRRLS